MKSIIGIVKSTKMNKTIVVEYKVEKMHSKYHKIMKSHRRIKAHNEDTTIHEGDHVEIRSTRPISKDKHYKVVKKISLA